jgi:hypothetical protein
MRIARPSSRTIVRLFSDIPLELSDRLSRRRGVAHESAGRDVVASPVEAVTRVSANRSRVR